MLIVTFMLLCSLLCASGMNQSLRESMGLFPSTSKGFNSASAWELLSLCFSLLTAGPGHRLSAFFLELSKQKIFCVPPNNAGRCWLASAWRLTRAGDNGDADFRFLLKSSQRGKVQWMEIGSFYPSPPRKQPLFMRDSVCVFLCVQIVLWLKGSISWASGRSSRKTEGGKHCYCSTHEREEGCPGADNLSRTCGQNWWLSFVSWGLIGTVWHFVSPPCLPDLTSVVLNKILLLVDINNMVKWLEKIFFHPFNVWEQINKKFLSYSWVGMKYLWTC